jgi:PPM family protein phosphatase
MFVELHAQTDVGRVRQGNEDNFLVLDLTTERSWTGADGDAPPDGLARFECGPRGVVLAVSDGMGGALAGDVASRMAVETVREMLVEDDTTRQADGRPVGGEPPLIEAVRNATTYANFAIHRRSLEDARCSGMGATLTAAAVTSGRLELVQVGDSRAYVIRGGEIRLATKDQSLVQQLVDVGQITEEDAETHMFRNVILQALGAQSDLAPVVSGVPLRRGDLVLLCSDGLSGKLRAEEIREIVEAAGGDLAAACDALVREANARGGEDNITVLLARFDGEDLTAAASDGIDVQNPPADAGNFPHETSEDDTSPIP